MDFRNFDRYLESLNNNLRYSEILGNDPDSLEIVLNMEKDLDFVPYISNVRCEIEEIRDVEYLYIIPTIEFPTMDTGVFQYSGSVSYELGEWKRVLDNLFENLIRNPYYDSMYDGLYEE